jgi:hypothetical protein
MLSSSKHRDETNSVGNGFNHPCGWRDNLKVTRPFPARLAAGEWQEKNSNKQKVTSKKTAARQVKGGGNVCRLDLQPSVFEPSSTPP